MQKRFYKISIKLIQQKNMKHIVTEDQFMLTSPEDELKEISLVDSVQKASFQSPKLRKLSKQKFAIDSWDISQRLQPCSTQTNRYKQYFSTNTSPKINKINFRAKSAFLSKDIQNTNNHNFNSKRKKSINPQSSPQTLFLNHSLNSIDRARKSIELEKTHWSNKGTLKSRKTMQRQTIKERQERMRTIESYLAHQKEQINRQREILYSQRVGKQGVNFMQYPTEYWQQLKKNYQTPKNRKRKLTKTLTKTTQPQQKKLSVSVFNPLGKLRTFNQIDQCQKSSSTKSRSPIKRFQFFQDKQNKAMTINY